jgi:hypothetical protein
MQKSYHWAVLGSEEKWDLQLRQWTLVDEEGSLKGSGSGSSLSRSASDSAGAAITGAALLPWGGGLTAGGRWGRSQERRWMFGTASPKTAASAMTA